MKEAEQLLSTLLATRHTRSTIKNRIFQGDALETLRTFPGNSIDCVITSPPYFMTRDYSVDGQMGREESIDKYVDILTRVFLEVKRVLTDQGNLWVNIGDKIENKDYLLIPEKFAIQMKLEGWRLVDKIIWMKPNVLPGTSKRRYTINHEYVYRFVKSDKFYFKAQYDPLSIVTQKEIEKEYKGKAIKDYQTALAPDPSVAKKSIVQSLTMSVKFGGKKAERTALAIGGKSNLDSSVYSGQNWKPATIILSETDRKAAMRLGWDGLTDYAYWYFHLRPKKGYHNHKSDKTKGMMQRGQGKAKLAYPYGSLKRSVWRISHANFKGDHYAVFPDALVAECLASACPFSVTEEGEERKGIVLDPFVGAGTVPVVAIRNGVDFVGIDLSPTSYKIALDRIRKEYDTKYSKMLKEGKVSGLPRDLSQNQIN